LSFQERRSGKSRLKEYVEGGKISFTCPADVWARHRGNAKGSCEPGLDPHECPKRMVNREEGGRGKRVASKNLLCR